MLCNEPRCAHAVLAQQQRGSVPDVSMLAGQDGGGQYALHAAAAHDAPMARHACRQRALHAQHPLVRIRRLSWRLQRFARDLARWTTLFSTRQRKQKSGREIFGVTTPQLLGTPAVSAR